jgi:anti-anti-sigma regulatory factor
MPASFHIYRERNERYWQLRLHGTFDGTSAWELRRALTRLGLKLPVEVDFSGVTELHEFGAATLAAGLLGRRWPPMQFVGLDLSARELLHRRGLDLDLPCATWPAPDPVLGLLSPPGKCPD